MKWWQRARRKTASASPAGDGGENILVISDIHLGEDITVSGPGHLSEYIRALNRELALFIAGHRQGDGKRWHLVINGDMFDFVKVSLGAPDDMPESMRQRDGTVPNTPENVVWKLQRILEIHRPLFRELAFFVREGHHVTLVEGNHDAEFYFPEVRQVLQAELLHLARQSPPAQGGRAQPVDEGDYLRRIAFCGWFTALPGHYHIEHGHQYDEFCSFEYNLAPFDRQDARTLATPLSHRPVPYFAELLGDFSTHGVSNWSFMQMLRFVASLGPRAVVTLSRLYVVVGFGLLRQAGKKRQKELQQLAEQHAGQLRRLSETTPYGFDTLQQLDALKAPPAEYSLLKMAHTFYLDRFLVVGVTGVSSLFAELYSGWQAASVLGCVGTLTCVLLAQVRRMNVGTLLRQAAARIAQVTGARYVVFGHSHSAEVVNLRQVFGVGRFGETCFYLNSGSWVTREILRGESGVGMTYVEISEKGACLKRWRGPDTTPLVLADTCAIA